MRSAGARVAVAARGLRTGREAPWQPSSIAIIPLAVLPRSCGMVKGETFFPLSRFSVCFSKVSMPPKAEPTTTPKRDWSMAPRSSPPSSIAMRLAATAKCVYLWTRAAVSTTPIDGVCRSDDACCVEVCSAAGL